MEVCLKEGTPLTLCEWKSAFGVPLVFFCAVRSDNVCPVTVPLHFETCELNGDLCTCNGCNGCVTVYVTLLPLHLPPLKGVWVGCNV